MTLVQSAPAKINLYLHVTGKRADGYHLLDSLAVFAAHAADTITAAAADELSLMLTGPMAPALIAEGAERSQNNLVLRAARSLAEAAGIRPAARLTLHKTLPVASGIGGGSADAAATLRALDQLWGLHTPAADLHRLALALGADVPVCLSSGPARMSGIGETLRAAPHLPDYGLLLVNPGVSVPTPAVFRARQGEFTPAPCLPSGFADAQALADFLAGCRNDLEPPAIALAPVIGETLMALRATPHILLARMSGSGATCFGLYPAQADARAAADQLRLAHADWWISA